MVNTYTRGSNEFQPLIVTKTVNGVVATVTTGVQYVLVPKGTDLLEGLPQTPSTLDGQIGFFTDSLAVGYYEVGVRVNSNPESPLVHAGYIRIK